MRATAPTDAQLVEKFERQSALVIGKAQTEALMAAAWSLPDLQDAGEVARVSVPRTARKTAV